MKTKPVSVVHAPQGARVSRIVQSFDTVQQAEAYIAEAIQGIDPTGVHNGDYQIDAPQCSKCAPSPCSDPIAHAVFVVEPESIVLYECGICSSMHPWAWNGDCREDRHRYADAEDYSERNAIPEERIEVRSWEERCEADSRGTKR